MHTNQLDNPSQNTAMWLKIVDDCRPAQYYHTTISLRITEVTKCYVFNDNIAATCHGSVMINDSSSAPLRVTILYDGENCFVSRNPWHMNTQNTCQVEGMELVWEAFSVLGDT